MYRPDEDKLRERLYKFFETHPRYSLFRASQEIGMSNLTLDNFIHRSKKSFRHTLLKIEKFLNDKENPGG